ncbi:MAG: LysE family translocator, partial [Cohaesibacteraceae bacterium]|nr:LysE family translocator [Cohaesibacteraceae bacterium]
MTLITFITFVLVFALAVMTPGPANIALVAQALATGFRKTLPMIGGMILGDFLYFVTTIYGLVLVAELMG